ncbi:MAG: hypothetical protein KUG82_18260 [Pseudomonadales bacterium]|nr:hypothetical protein [Pseudomonadales bacterium]
MVNPSELGVLGLTSSTADAGLLEGTLDKFRVNIRKLPLAEQSEKELTVTLSDIMSQTDPHIVIILLDDIVMASKILTQAKKTASDSCSVPPYWVVITQETAQEELVKHLGELDVESIFFAPFTAEQITVNLISGYQVHAEHVQLEEQYKSASDTAKSAMVAASEIGYVMQLVENLGNAVTYDEVSATLFKVLNGLGVKSYLQIDDGHDAYVFSDSDVSVSIQKILSDAHASNAHFIEHKRLLLLRLNHVVIMISNAPWQDATRYGRIKDLICQMGPVVEARVRTIMVNELIGEQHGKVMSIMDMMRQLSADTQNHSRNIMQDLSGKLEIAAMSLDLNENQEEHLLGLSTGALDSLEMLYQTNDALEGHFLTLMSSITRVRDLSNEQMQSGDHNDDADSVELF